MTGLHMSGAGNDFVVVDARGCDTDLAALAVKACAITGADGFLALDSSKIADFRLHFTILTVCGAKCAATVPAASAAMPMSMASPEKA